MADATIYIINSTDESVSFAIQPRTFDGALGVQQNTDLTLYGNAAPNWGERFNENFYKLLETFACPESVTYPGFPQTEGEIGTPGSGINNPIVGQQWYNKTNGLLYTYNGASWDLVYDGDSVTTALSTKVDLDGGNSPMTGSLEIQAAGARFTANATSLDPWFALKENGSLAGIFALDSPTNTVVVRRYKPQGNLAGDYVELRFLDDYVEFGLAGGSILSPDEAKVRSPSTQPTDHDNTMTTKDYVDNLVLGSSGLVGITPMEGLTFIPADEIDQTTTINWTDLPVSNQTVTAPLSGVNIPLNATHIVLTAILNIDSGTDTGHIEVYTRRDASSPWIPKSTIENQGNNTWIQEFDDVTETFEIQFTVVGTPGGPTFDVDLFPVGFYSKDTGILSPMYGLTQVPIPQIEVLSDNWDPPLFSTTELNLINVVSLTPTDSVKPPSATHVVLRFWFNVNISTNTGMSLYTRQNASQPWEVRTNMDPSPPAGEAESTFMVIEKIDTNTNTIDVRRQIRYDGANGDGDQDQVYVQAWVEGFLIEDGGVIDDIVKFDNAIINGQFDIWQRGTSFNLLAGVGQYTADRMISFPGSDTGTATVIRLPIDTDTVQPMPATPQYCLRHTQTAGYTVTERPFIAQKIENFRTFAGDDVTISFWVRATGASVSLYSTGIVQSATGTTVAGPSTQTQTFPVNVTPLSSSWQLITSTMTMGTIEGLTPVNGNGLDFIEWYAYFDVPVGDFFEITNIQLERGVINTPYQKEHISETLTKCQRYYQTMSRRTLPLRDPNTSTEADFSGNRPIVMRSVPTTSYTIIGGIPTAITSNEYVDGFRIRATQSDGVTEMSVIDYVAESEL